MRNLIFLFLLISFSSLGQNSSSDTTYHIIGGSFKIKSNANKCVDYWSQYGYWSKIISRKNGFYRVSIHNYNNLSDARDFIKKLSALKEEHFWIYKIPNNIQ